MVRITALDSGKSLNHIRSPSALFQYVRHDVSMSMFGATVTQYLNVSGQKGDFWPPEGKRSRVRSYHYHLTCIFVSILCAGLCVSSLSSYKSIVMVYTERRVRV